MQARAGGAADGGEAARRAADRAAAAAGAARRRRLQQQPAAFPPAAAWPLHLLEGWTADDVLRYGLVTGHTSVRRMRGRDAARYARALGAVLVALVASPDDERLALLFGIMPALLLHRSPVETGGRRSDRTLVHGRLARFWSLDWAPLLEALYPAAGAAWPRRACCAAQC